MALMLRPKASALKSALRQSNMCTARGVRGSAHQPMTSAAMPNGMLMANSHGQLPKARMPEATVGNALFKRSVVTLDFHSMTMDVTSAE